MGLSLFINNLNGIVGPLSIPFKGSVGISVYLDVIKKKEPAGLD